MAAVFIAVLALLFTVGSFWWLHARPGRLVGNRPGEVALAITPQQSRFRFGLVLYNTGARTLVVEELRLRIIEDDRALEWITTRDRLRPTSDERIDFCCALPVDGRRAVPLSLSSVRPRHHGGRTRGQRIGLRSTFGSLDDAIGKRSVASY